jgi:hypothetical protein
MVFEMTPLNCATEPAVQEREVDTIICLNARNHGTNQFFFFLFHEFVVQTTGNAIGSASVTEDARVISKKFQFDHLCLIVLLYARQPIGIFLSSADPLIT